MLEEERFDGASVEDVAKASGVSLRTVYRYFPDRQALVEAVAVYADEHATYEMPTSPEEISTVFARLFVEFDGMPALTRAAIVARIKRPGVWPTRTVRVEQIGAVVDRATRGLPPADRRRARAVIVYLANSLAWLSMADESELDGADAGAAVGWAIQTLFADIERRAHARKRGRQ